MQKVTKSILNSDLFPLSTIILIALLIFGLPLISKGYPYWADNNPPTLNMGAFNELSDFTYANSHNGLIYDGNFIVTNFLLNKVFKLINVFVPDIKTLSFLWVFLPYLTLYICLYFSFKILFGNKILSFFLALFYIFSNLNFTQIIYGWSTTTYSQAGGFLFLSYLIKYLRYPRLKYLVTMSLLSTICFVNVAHFYGVLVCSMIYFFVYVLVNKIEFKKIIVLYRNLVLLPFFTIFVNAYWILATIFMHVGKGFIFNFKDIYNTDVYTPFNTFNFLTSVSLFAKYAKVFSFFNSNLFRSSFVFLLLISFFYVIKYVHKNKYLKLIFSVYLLGFGISMGAKFSISWSLIKVLPGSFVFRSPQLKIFPILFFLFSLLVGIVISKYKPKLLIGSVCLVMLLGVIGFYKGNLFSYWKNIVIPDDYLSIIRYLDHPNNRYETVIILPM